MAIRHNHNDNRLSDDVTVSISTIPTIVAPEARDSLAQGMSRSLNSKIQTSSHDYMGPRVEFSDVATIVSFAADLTALLGFIGGPLVLLFKKPEILQGFKRLIDEGTPKDEFSPLAFPVVVEFGVNPNDRSVRFYFHREPTEGELIAAWKSAQSILLSLPSEALQDWGGPPLVGYFWDISASQWRGTNFFEAMKTGNGYNGTWFPPDFPPNTSSSTPDSSIATTDQETNSLRVTSRAFQPVVDEEAYSALIATISQGLKSPVETELVDFEPPASGMSEIAAVISFLADSKEVIVPVSTWLAGQFGGPAWKTLRKYIDGSRRSKVSGRPYIPLCVVFGTDPRNPDSVRFYFHGRPDKEQLNRQFEAMHRVLDTLPEEALAEMAGAPEYGYFWDEKQSRWRGQLYYSARRDGHKTWFPDDLLDSVPGWTSPPESDERNDT